jgi:protein-tyrosine phosphatase
LEEDEAKKYGFEYIPVCVEPDWLLSKDLAKEIDRITQIIERSFPDTWFHVHCKAGKGRTSTLLAMIDMIKNALEVSLEDIVKRHSLMGSENLLNVEKWTNGTYSTTALETRKKFIVQYYNFIIQKKAGGISLWSEWQEF